jgi:hypothetical protein
MREGQTSGGGSTLEGRSRIGRENANRKKKKKEKKEEKKRTAKATATKKMFLLFDCCYLNRAGSG